MFNLKELKKYSFNDYVKFFKRYFVEFLLPTAFLFALQHWLWVAAQNIDYASVTHGYWCIDVHTIFDNWIPRITSGFGEIYMAAIWFWIILPGFIYTLCGKKRFYKFIATGCIVYVVAFVFWSLFPVFDYMNDKGPTLNKNNFCSFPSAHVFSTYLIFIASRGYKENKKMEKYGRVFCWFMFVWTILLIMSTWFVKQHFVMDFIPSIFMSEVIWFFVCHYGNKYINWIQKCFTNINCFFTIEYSSKSFINKFSGKKKLFINAALIILYICIVCLCVFTFLLGTLFNI